jgi:hypothetical protein
MRCAQRVGKKSIPSVQAALPVAIASSSRAAKFSKIVASVVTT